MFLNSVSGPRGGCDKASEGGEGLIYHLSTSATGTPVRGVGGSLIPSMAAAKRKLSLIELLLDNELPHPVTLLCITLAQNIEFLTKQTNKQTQRSWFSCNCYRAVISESGVHGFLPVRPPSGLNQIIHMEEGLIMRALWQVDKQLASTVTHVKLL